MTTARTTHPTKAERKAAALARIKAEQAAQARRARIRSILLGTVALVVVAALVTVGTVAVPPVNVVPVPSVSPPITALRIVPSAPETAATDAAAAVPVGARLSVN